MTIRDILVRVGERPAAEARLDAALTLAVALGARLRALALVEEPYQPVTGIGLPIPADILRRQAAVVAAQAEQWLDEVARRAADACVTLETRRDIVSPDQLQPVFVHHARLVDLVVVGQPDPDESTMAGRQLIEAAFLASGRPALLVPRVGKPTLPPRRVMVAWDGSREASRALHDALPFLKLAAEVELVIIDPERLGHLVGQEPGVEIAAHLARHGVGVEIARVPSGGLEIADALLDRAIDHGAQMIVMGAYGHSRLLELMLGGTTRQILEQTSVPVLLSH